MSPWELKDWLGHNSIRSTEWYVSQRPLMLAKKYAAADLWRRNLARVKVILDAEVIESGAADLGHGYCNGQLFLALSASYGVGSLRILRPEGVDQRTIARSGWRK